MDICTEKNRCSANPCGENGSCVNENSSYRCNCNPGYQFDGNTCYDIDECNEQVMTRHDFMRCTIGLQLMNGSQCSVSIKKTSPLLVL